MQKRVVVWLSTNISRLYENGGLFYNHLGMQNKSNFFRCKNSFEEIHPSWRTVDWPFSSWIACIGWLETIAWDDLHWQKLCYCDYKVHYWQLFADFTINSLKCFFSLVKRNRHTYFKSLALWLRAIKLYSVLYQIDVYCYFFS